MSKATIKAIFFDAVGTLIHPEPSAAAVYAEVGVRFGSRHSRAEIGARFKAAFKDEEQRDAAHGWRTDEARELRRWQDIVGAVLDDVVDHESCFRELYHHFAHPQFWRTEPKMIALVQRLASAGWILGMASNYDHRLRSVLAGLPVLHCIERIVISAEVGWRKPAPEFFAAVCRTAELPAEKILFVGDDPANDHEGALRAGMPSFLLRGPESVDELAALLT